VKTVTEEPTLHRGILLCLSAPSGAGKTTLAHKMLKAMPEAKFSVSFTTRARRGEEKDGVDYRFIDAKHFQAEIDQGAFVEWAEVHGHFYGSSQQVVDEAFSTGGVAVFDIDVQGGAAIKKKYPDAVLVFILPPSMEELERRLRDRKTDSDETINKRLLAARAEMQRGVASYDYLVINDDIESAWRQLESIVVAERCRRGRVDLSRIKIGPV
jgi:guanylate kinase